MQTTLPDAVAQVAREWAAGPRSHEPLVLQPDGAGGVMVQLGFKTSYSVTEAAEFMGVSVATFRRRYMQTGLVSKRLGRIPAGQLTRLRERNLK